MNFSVFPWFLLFFCFQMSTNGFGQTDKIDGLTMVAPPEAFGKNPIDPIKKVNADWICLVPYGFSNQTEPKIRYNSDWQWWGERPEGIRESIRLAHEQKVKVMLKPQVYIPGGWVGYVDFDNEEDWQLWEQSYRTYIFHWLAIAKEMDVEMFCIGTEYVLAAQKRESFWRSLIKDIRKEYCGLLVYSSNWDAYKRIPFWDDLDFIGLSAYFPLSEDKTPRLNQLKKTWKPVFKEIKEVAQKHNKKILFTEFGYLSVDGCAGKTWELEKKVKSLPINEEAQKIALNALFDTFWEADFWAGGFMWKWFPNMRGHEGYPERDYTPQGKLAEDTISKWYSESK